MARPDSRATVRTLLADHGRTYAQDAGIRLKDTPQPLYQLLVLACMLSARIRAGIAVAAARALFGAGMRSARSMADATWQRRVDALGEGGYRRYDERTSTMLGEGAEQVIDAYGGDLRRLRKQADGDLDELRGLLRKVPGIGPAGADIFLREVQGVWPEVAPYFDQKTLDGAERLGLPRDPKKLADLVGKEEFPALAAALVRAALDRDVVDEVLAAADKPGALAGPDGVAAASTLGYGGMLLGPPAIGFLADWFSLPVALTTVAALAAGAALIGYAARNASAPTHPPIQQF